MWVGHGDRKAQKSRLWLASRFFSLSLSCIEGSGRIHFLKWETRSIQIFAGVKKVPRLLPSVPRTVFEKERKKEKLEPTGDAITGWIISRYGEYRSVPKARQPWIQPLLFHAAAGM